MYRLLVADDEKKLLSGLCDYYPWQELGFQIVYKASDGQKALDYIVKNSVDVVLTDISMPIMGGIELARILCREYPHIKIVFLSGYAEFKYAQQAIQYGVQNYILKPVKPSEIKETFTEIRQKLDKEKGIQKEEAGYYENILKTVESYVRYNIRTANLEDAAQTVNLSAGYLSALYKKETGKNLSDYICKVRMEQAKEALQRPDHKIYDISEQLGYENPKNFSRAFKKYWGVSPQDFRMKTGRHEDEA